MRWTQALLAVIALTPLGCVEQPMTAKPSDPPAAEKQPPPPTPTTPKRASQPPAPDDTDPVVKAAQLSGERVAQYEERIDEALSAVAADLETLSGTDFRAVDQTAEKLLTTVQLLRGSGERILERYPKVKADLAGIVKANAGVKVGYGRARELYREKAEAESGDLKDRYLALADLCDAFLGTSDERTAQYAAFAKDLERAIAKVERHVLFLADFEAFLKLHPPTHGAKERADFLTSLNAFAEQVLKFGDVLRTFRDKVRAGAVSLKLRGEHEKALAAARAEREKVVAAKATDGAKEAAKETSKAESEARDRTVKDTAGAPKAAVAADTRPGVECATEVASPRPVRFVPVIVTRCVSTLVPVTYISTHRGPCGCQPVAVTRYEWRNRLVTETHYATVCH